MWEDTRNSGGGLFRLLQKGNPNSQKKTKNYL